MHLLVIPAEAGIHCPIKARPNGRDKINMSAPLAQSFINSGYRPMTRVSAGMTSKEPSRKRFVVHYMQRNDRVYIVFAKVVQQSLQNRNLIGVRVKFNLKLSSVKLVLWFDKQAYCLCSGGPWVFQNANSSAGNCGNPNNCANNCGNCAQNGSNNSCRRSALLALPILVTKKKVLPNSGGLCNNIHRLLSIKRGQNHRITFASKRKGSRPRIPAGW